jgi:hypothetical protein
LRRIFGRTTGRAINPAIVTVVRFKVQRFDGSKVPLEGESCAY